MRRDAPVRTRPGSVAWGGVRRMVWGGVVVLGVCCGGCDGYPRDPEGTFERVRGGTLRVGASESAWLRRTDAGGAEGPEAEVVRAFAESVGAEVAWVWGSTDEHLRALEAGEVDVVAGGIAAGSPWKGRVALTRAWRGEGKEGVVLAVRSGENRTLVALERAIESRRGGNGS